MTFKDFVGSGSTGIIGVVNGVVVPIIMTLAFLAFIWGVIDYFFIHGGDDSSRAEGRQFVIWGVIGLVVLYSVWAIVKILLSTLGILPAA